MGLPLLFLIAVFTALLQHGLVATWPLSPDLPLALMAWAVVSGPANELLVRAWLIGMARDVIDPASLCFHTVGYTLLAGLFLPLRSQIYHGRAAGWMGYAAVASVLLALVDRWLAGVTVWWPLGVLMGNAGLTAFATLPIAWLMLGIPKPLRLRPDGQDLSRRL